MLNARKYKVGGSIAKMPENPIDRSTVIINNLGKSECLEESLSLYRYYVNLAEAFIGCLSEKDAQMVRDKFIKGKSWAWIEMNHYMSIGGARKRIVSLIDKFIDIT